MDSGEKKLKEKNIELGYLFYLFGGSANIIAGYKGYGFINSLKIG